MSKFFASGDSSRAAHDGVPRSAGFSLIEIAIALIIVGLIMLPIAQMYKIYMKSLSLSDTRGAQNEIITAINRFYQNGNLRYPCPASLVVPENNAAYGAETVCASLPPCPSAGWKNPGGQGACAMVGPGETVVIGAVPFRALGLDPEQTKDFWNNRFLYAVTLNQTVSATFEAATGGISLFTVDRQVPPSTNPADLDGIPDLYCDGAGACYNDIDIILVSTGHNGAGGFSGGGAALPACPGSANGREFENCNMDKIFLHHTDPDDSLTGARSERAGDTFFDDIVLYQRFLPENIWYPTPAGLTHVITDAAHIGIGMSDPRDFMVQVEGSARIDGGILTKSICNPSNECFDPEIVTGDRPELQCDDLGSFYGEQSVTRITEGKVRCALPANIVGDRITDPDEPVIDPLNPEDAIGLPPSFQQGNCAASYQLVRGFDASGAPVCVTP